MPLDPRDPLRSLISDLNGSLGPRRRENVGTQEMTRTHPKPLASPLNLPNHSKQTSLMNENHRVIDNSRIKSFRGLALRLKMEKCVES